MRATIIVLLAITAFAYAAPNWLDFGDNPVVTYYPEEATCQQFGEFPPCNPWAPPQDIQGEEPKCAMTSDGRICSLSYPQDKRDVRWTCYTMYNCRYKRVCPCGYVQVLPCGYDYDYDPPLARCSCTQDARSQCGK